jgi:shikimate kinase
MKNLILCGFKSSGKTHFGQLFAQKKGIAFFDTDALVEEEIRESCPEFVKKYGEKAFREVEAKIVSRLSDIKNSVIALGGGTLLNPESAALISRLGVLVYLVWTKEMLKKRLLVPPLPSFLIGDHPEKKFEEMYTFRAPLYEKLCHEKICVENAPEETVLKVLESVYGK